MNNCEECIFCVENELNMYNFGQLDLIFMDNGALAHWIDPFFIHIYNGEGLAFFPENNVNLTGKRDIKFPSRDEKDGFWVVFIA